MTPDDTVCYCFHVSMRKVQTFCRVRRPRVPSQISECLSAGTGCGWCVPLLKKIHRDALGHDAGASAPEAGEPSSANIADPAEYAAARERYLAAKKTPRP